MGWSNPFVPTPAPPGFAKGKTIPESRSSWLSRMTFWWMGPFLSVGYSRPLMEDDFWELPPARHTDVLTDRIEHDFFMRCPPEKRPAFMPSPPHTEKAEDEKASETETAPNSPKPEFDESFFSVVYGAFKLRMWLAILLNLAADTLRTTTPLVNKIFITWLTQAYIYARIPESDRALAAAAGLEAPRPIGYGIGLGFAIFAMQVSASIMNNQSTLACMTTGLYARSGIVGTIFRKSLRLSGKARSEHTVGQITTLISADATRLDQFFAFAPHLISAPIQIILGVGLLIGTLGYSTLAGFAVLIAAMPFQLILVLIMMRQVRRGLKITDKRVRLTTEVLQGIRLIKVYGWEAFYSAQIAKFRTQEIETIRKASFAASLMIALFSFIPVLAAVIAFITYALTGHDLNIATIFTALQLFNIIRFPLTIFPMVLSAFADARVSLGRITKFLLAEELAQQYLIEPGAPSAVHVDGDFAWEVVPALEEAKNKEKEKEKNMSPTELALKKQEEAKKKKEEEKAAKKKKKAEEAAAAAASGTPARSGWWRSKKPAVEVTEVKDPAETAEPDKDEKPEEKPFELNNLKFDVPKGAFVAIIGRVGSGKSSILQALIGEMKRTHGEVVFGGSIAYVPQAPWIKNATVRDNIMFGLPEDEDRFHEVLSACNLEHDLSIFPNGDQTEIGEKGINLSGGQKARVSLARAAYSSADIVLMDDPLSAVDSYVGKHLVDHCLMSGPLAKRTRILVTHALHMLHKTDYIYVVDEGKIVEKGTYDELMGQSQIFRRIIEEHGSKATQSGIIAPKAGTFVRAAADAIDPANKLDSALMQLEERNTGAVSWGVYKKYLRSGGGLFWAPLILGLLLITEAGNVTNTLFLGFWTGNQIAGFSQGEYMGVYAGLGGVIAVGTFLATYAFILMTLVASLNLFKQALSAVLHSPVSFFDTTPIGRILSRFSKDIDTIDQQLPIAFLQFMMTLLSIFGTVGLVFYTFPYLGIIFLPLGILYYGASVFYRRSSVETKRLDSLLRSILYASYSESLTGLATIRAYGKQKTAHQDAERGLDLQNRATYMTVAIQRWLALRLDFFGNILLLGICLFGAGYRTSVNPAKFGVVLSYTLGMTQIFAEIVTLFAACEQNMNAVERVAHYIDLPSEGHESDKADVPSDWPLQGTVKFSDVHLAYREGLPTVLKGISFDVRPGEKVGIVGRTGSGKSSLIQALLRMVELQSGKIEIDGVDVGHLNLQTLRTRLGFVPQDTTLFLGTLRDNLDPERIRTDAELVSVLQRAWLLPKEGPVDPAVEAKFSLDSTVTDEGANYSAGEKQLLALCRALVKNSRIIILDEATSSVDVETDSKVQRTIQTEFKSSTLLCIAHRLNTIAYYDRILVMDNGNVAEFDTVLNLFDTPGSIFRALCDEANLSRDDIAKIRSEHDAAL